MTRIARILLIAGTLVTPMAAFGALPQVGEMPVPVVKDVTVNTSTTYDSSAQVYTYRYSITNPASNTGTIGDIRIDMTAPAGYRCPSYHAKLTIPFGKAGNLPFSSLRSMTSLSLPYGETIIPYGQRMPSDWLGLLSAGGEADFASVGGGYSSDVQPGQTKTGFILISPGLPTIKMITLHPSWELVTDGEATEREETTAARVEQALTIQLPALAPSGTAPGSFDQWDQFRDDITHAIRLGWISDTTFGQQVASDLAAARKALDTEGPAHIQQALATLLHAIKASAPNQRNQMAYELLLLNTQALLDSPLQQGNQSSQQRVSPKYTFITPDPQILPVDKTVTVTAKVVDQGNNDAPIVGKSVRLYVAGVNSDKGIVGKTNKLGEISLTYKGTLVGTDVVHIASRSLPSPPSAVISTVAWQGGPDLTLVMFAPPVIHWRGSGTIYIYDETENIGDAPANEPSVTRYYVSATNPVVPASSQVVGQRTVPPLKPGAINNSVGVRLPLPSNLAPGIYFLTACVNATRTVGETNYYNNCQSQHGYMTITAPDGHRN